MKRRNEKLIAYSAPLVPAAALALLGVVGRSRTLRYVAGAAGLIGATGSTVTVLKDKHLLRNAADGLVVMTADTGVITAVFMPAVVASAVVLRRCETWRGRTVGIATALAGNIAAGIVLNAVTSKDSK